MSARRNRRYSVGQSKFHYVCEPNSMNIIAEIAPSAHGKINVILYINGKETLYGTYMVENLDIDTINSRVATFCKGITFFTEEDIQMYVDIDKATLARYAYRSLKEVRNKLGRLIWKRS